MTEKFQAHSDAIQCEGCANSIQRSLGKMTGVHQVVVDVSSKTIRVEYDPAQVKAGEINERLSQAGFPVT